MDIIDREGQVLWASQTVTDKCTWWTFLTTYWCVFKPRLIFSSNKEVNESVIISTFAQPYINGGDTIMYYLMVKVLRYQWNLEKIENSVNSIKSTWLNLNWKKTIIQHIYPFALEDFGRATVENARLICLYTCCTSLIWRMYWRVVLHSTIMMI